MHENLYIITEGDTKAYKSANTPYWLWEDGNIIGIVPMFVIATTAWALGSHMIFAFICMFIMWVIWIINFNLHELYRTLRLRVYLRTGRVLKSPTDLGTHIRQVLDVAEYKDSAAVTSDTFGGLRVVFSDYSRTEMLAPSKHKTWEVRFSVGKAQVDQVLNFELNTRRNRAIEREQEITLFNDGQEEMRQMYEGG